MKIIIHVLSESEQSTFLSYQLAGTFVDKHWHRHHGVLSVHLKIFTENYASYSPHVLIVSLFVSREHINIRTTLKNRSSQFRVRSHSHFAGGKEAHFEKTYGIITHCLLHLSIAQFKSIKNLNMTLFSYCFV